MDEREQAISDEYPTPVSGILYSEDVPTTDGLAIRAGALTWDLPIPVTAPIDGQRNIVGSVDEIAVVDGDVTFKGRVTDASLIADLTPAVEISNYGEFREEGPHLVVPSGRLRGVHLTEEPSFTEAIIRVDEEDA